MEYYPLCAGNEPERQTHETKRLSVGYHRSYPALRHRNVVRTGTECTGSEWMANQSLSGADSLHARARTSRSVLSETLHGERDIGTTRAGTIRIITPTGVPQARNRNIHQAMAVRSKQYAGESQFFSGCTTGCPNASISVATSHDTRKPHRRKQGRCKRTNKTLTTLYENYIKKILNKQTKPSWLKKHKRTQTSSRC